MLAALGVVAASGIALYVWRLNKLIKESRQQQDAARRVEVIQSGLRAPSTDGLTIYLDAADVRATAALSGVRYLATSGGLIALDDEGAVKHRYTTLDGLPDNDLTALAVFRGRLFIGTASHGLIAYDGNAFTGFVFSKPKASIVTTLLETPAELLIGTLDGGLFEYDGERFSRRFSSTTGADFTRVTALAALDTRIYVGTQDQGLYIWREAHIEHIGTSEGLPSPHVTAILALRGHLSDLGEVAVATDFGVVGLKAQNEIKPISSVPNVTSLALSGGKLWAGLFSGGITALGSDHNNTPVAQREVRPDVPDMPDGEDVTGLPSLTPTVVYAGGGKLWVLTRKGAYSRDEGATRPAFEPVAGQLASDRLLSGRHVTSLAFDGAGRLWAGYFDGGIDTISPETNERLSHIEDDRVREINFITYDPGQDRMLVATSRGLATFDRRFKETLVTRAQGGLINDSVAHVSLEDPPNQSQTSAGGPALAAAGSRATVLATAGGLTEIADGRARSITAFHGLASNHLYTTAISGSTLFVGSLAGLVELEGLRVVRTYKRSNSHLSDDWVTALASGDGTLYIGTNGGGVDALLPSGEWINFADDIGRFEVNQNAIHLDGDHLYIGTSEQGLLVYNTRGRRWTRFNSALPSQSVTAITSDANYIYAGTLNGLMRIEKRVIQ